MRPTHWMRGITWCAMPRAGSMSTASRTRLLAVALFGFVNWVVYSEIVLGRTSDREVIATGLIVAFVTFVLWAVVFRAARRRRSLA